MSFVARGAFDPQGPAARVIDDLWWVLLGLGTIAFLIFAVVLAVGLFRGQASSESPRRDRPSGFIVLGGVVLPTVMLSVVMVLTVRAMNELPDEGPEGALQVEVIGHRWWWEVRYPESGVVTANEVHLPVGRPVEFHLSSADVIHSFWIPQLGGKMDLLPEDVNVLVLEADEPGVHRTQCAEFCGLQHAKMRLLAIVEPEDRFEAWLDEQRQPGHEPTSAAARRGRTTFSEANCSSCHTIRGTDADGKKGPDLTHLASRRTLAAASLENTADQLFRWIDDPHEVKEGVLMPNVDLDRQQVDDLVAFLGGLR